LSAVGLAAALALLSASARADLDETLDLSFHAARAGIDGDEASLREQVPALGVRLGQTRDELRFGLGVFGALPKGMRSFPEGDHASLVTGEIYMGYAPGGFWNVRPFVEARLHYDRLQLGSDVTTWLGFGPRVGALVPLSEYFFVDVGVSRDLRGPEAFRGSIGIGLPIPISHL
jgi:hypothetical protein